MLSSDGTLNPSAPRAVEAVALSRISIGLVTSNVPTSSRYLKVTPPHVNDLNSFAVLATPGSSGAPRCATAAGLSRWKIWLFVHFAPPWQEAQCVPKSVAPGAGF